MNELIDLLNGQYSEDMERASLEVLKKFDIDDVPVPIVRIMSELGFKVVVQNYEEDNLSGIIGIDFKLVDKFGSDKVISLNRKHQIGHQRFTMAHELCHYIFDFDRNSLEPYYDAYDTSQSDLDNEIRANTFAANLLMPKNVFKKKYEECKGMKKYDKVLELSKRFQVSGTAVTRRIEELRL